MTGTSRVRRISLAVGMVAGPVLVALSVYISPSSGDTNEAYYQAVAAHRTRFMIATACLAWGLFMLVCAAAAFNLLAPRRGSVLTLVGSLMLAVGGLGAGGSYWGDTLIQSSLTPEVDRAVTELLDTNGPALLFALPRLLIILGCVVSALGLLRARTVPRGAAIMVLAGGLLCALIGSFGTPSQLLALPLAAGMLGVAVRLVRGPGGDAPREAAAPPMVDGARPTSEAATTATSIS